MTDNWLLVYDNCKTISVSIDSFFTLGELGCLIIQTYVSLVPSLSTPQTFIAYSMKNRGVDVNVMTMRAITSRKRTRCLFNFRERP